MKLAEVSVRRPVFAVMMSAALIVLGWFSYRDLGLDLMPRTDYPTVNVRAGLNGASAEEIETTITKPIEAAVNTINGIDELRCSSNQGNGSCTITFTLEREIEAATQDVRDKVATVRFPRDTEPPVVSKIDPDAAPILTLVVFSNRSPKEITQIADKQIKQVLETVQDVGEVQLIGDRRREIRVLLDPNRLNAYGLTVDQVGSADRAAEHRDPRRQLHRRTVRDLDAHHGAAAQRPGVREDRPLVQGRLGDHASATSRASPTRTRKCAARPGSTARTPSRCRSASSRAPTPSRSSIACWRGSSGSRRRCRRTSASKPTRDQSRFIRKSFEEIQLHLILGGVLAALVVFLFIRNLRVTIIAGAGDPDVDHRHLRDHAAARLHAEQHDDARALAGDRHRHRRRDRRAREHLPLHRGEGRDAEAGGDRRRPRKSASPSWRRRCRWSSSSCPSRS